MNTKKRHVVIDGKRTTLSIEDAFWSALAEIAKSMKTTRIDLIRLAHKTAKPRYLASELRVFVLRHVQERAKNAIKVSR